jgi:hypothetical protein
VSSDIPTLPVLRGSSPFCQDEEGFVEKANGGLAQRRDDGGYDAKQPQRVLPQYIDVPAKIASTGCILSCHCILSKLACQAYFHVPAIAGIDRF